MTTPSAVPDPSRLVFGKYEPVRRLAIGGMGEVFLARQVGVPGFERPVILKNLLPELAEQPGFVDQFLDEARVAATLNHPNVVAIYEVGLWNGVHYLAMEYIHGVDLAKLIQASLRHDVEVPVAVAARIIRDAALGLHAVHEARDVAGNALNIVHRDISPQNIMVRGDGVAKVVDFGIAKAANRVTRTQTGSVKGKLSYMPPEQVLGETVLDARADQYALGVVAWELLACRRLYKAENDLLVMQMILQQDAPLLSTQRVVPPVLEAMVARMLSRNRDDRYAHLGDVVDVLNGYLATISPPVDERAVSLVVQGLVGGDLDERFKAFTPANSSNFVLDLRANKTGPTGAPPDIQQPPRARSAARTWGLAAAGSVGILAVLGVVAFRVAPVAPPAPTSTPAPVPPTVAQPPILVPDVGVETVDGTARVRVRSPAGAAIALDGQDTGKTAPAVLEDVPPGEHAVQLTLGGAQAVQRVTVAARESPPVVEVVSSPSGAAVWLGDRPVGSTPLKLESLAAGQHYELRVTLRGYQEATVVVEPQAGKFTRHDVPLTRLERRPAPSPKAPRPEEKVEAAPGMFSLRTTPWANIEVDGKRLGTTPIYQVPLSAGKHTVSLRNDAQGLSVTRTVVIVGGGHLNETWTIK